jgi:hypothetical protein
MPRCSARRAKNSRPYRRARRCKAADGAEAAFQKKGEGIASLLPPLHRGEATENFRAVAPGAVVPLALGRPRATPRPGKCFLPRQKYTAFCQGNFLQIQGVDPMSNQLEDSMSIEGKIKEAAGYVKEELHENGDSPEARRKAQEGRIEDGRAPKLGMPGTED